MNKLWSPEDLGEHLGIPVHTIYQWRTRGYGPPGHRIGRHIRYRPEDVHTWINEQKDH